MKRVVISGASGFIGQKLVSRLLNENIEVYAIIRNRNSLKKMNVQSPFLHILLCDMDNIQNLDKLVGDKNIDVFYHLAWEGSSGKARGDYLLQMNNVTQSVNCMKMAKIIGVKRFVAIGTIAERLMENIDNTSIIALNAMYAITKDYTHKLLNAVASQLDIEFVWCRLSNIYGPGDTTSNIINYTIQSLLNNKKTEYSTGEQPCNMLYIDDCVDALFTIGDAELIKRHTYFVGGNEIRSVHYFVEKTKENILPNMELGWGLRKNDGIVYKAEWLGTWEMQEDFEYVAKTKFEEGIKKTIEWCQQ